MSKLWAYILRYLPYKCFKLYERNIKMVIPLTDNLITDDILKKNSDIILAASRLKVLSHPIRLKIICQLAHAEKTVQQLIDHVGTTQSNVSQHLAIMRQSNILNCRKSATQVFYKVADLRTIELVKLLKQIYCS